MNTAIFTQRTDWNGITLEVSWEPSWFSLPESHYAVGHLQLRSIAPERAPLPVTETGYRSLFINSQDVMNEGGPLAFACAWLDCEARHPSWRAQQESARQLPLF